MVDPQAGWPQTEFDGDDDYLSGAMTAADGKVGLISFWFKPDVNASDEGILANTSQWFEVKLNSANRVDIQGWSTGPTTRRLWIRSTAVGNSIWHHAAASWNLATPVSHLYINGVSDNSGPVNTDANIAYDQAAWSVAARTGGTNPLDGSISELYFALEYLDLSIAANLQKFRTAEGRQVYLGADGSTPTGTQPLIYVKPTWTVGVLNAGANAGSDIDFTVNGAPTYKGSIQAADTVGTPSEANRSGFYPTDERWYMCDRDGWWYPKSETRFEEHSGLRVSLDDYNEDDSQERDMLHQSIFTREEEQTE